MDIQHIHTERGGKFYNGDLSSPIALLVYRMAGAKKTIIDHTEVNEHKGEGVGTQLVDAAVTYAREHGIKIMPVCSFARDILENDSKYADVLFTPNS